MRFTPTRTAVYTERVERAYTALSGADALLIGAGAGLSSAAGLLYDGPRFAENFEQFIARYDMRDMYTSSFYNFDTEEERWAYWALHIGINRFDPPALPLYRDLCDLARPFEHFVITTNVEHQFIKSGFDPDRVFAVQGNYGNLQCAVGCHDQLYDNEALVTQMRAATIDCRIPSELVPHCPVCRGPMDVNLRKDHYFVQDALWAATQERYQHFLTQAINRKLVLLEIGVGYNTPGIIRYPFERLIHLHPDATLIRINAHDPGGPPENATRTIAFTEDTVGTIAALRSGLSRINND